ncbi:hypothetical protein GCM10017562_65090 [Streptomyces roseofulvus]|uniref:hypothetical protein n=1 Tax=Streptomyces roseofulvus TaxID=33902 RepID=UPI0031FC0F39
MKTLAIPFLACEPEQYDPAWADEGFGTEASLFDRADLLDPDSWATVRRTVRSVAGARRHPSFTFHFPVNDCDYVADPVVRDRLWEAVDMVADNELDGLVLHSNRVRTTEQWRELDLRAERDRFAEFVQELGRRVAGERFWIGLENMPLMGNDATDFDPLLVFPQDVAGLCSDNIGLTWDFCHYSYSVHIAGLLAQGLVPDSSDYVPVPDGVGHLDFTTIDDLIVHHHFSAFLGQAVRGGEQCIEGVAPWESTLPERVYADAFAAIARSARARTVTLEIREEDYRRRTKVFEVARWCRDILEREGARA